MLPAYADPGTCLQLPNSRLAAAASLTQQFACLSDSSGSNCLLKVVSALEDSQNTDLLTSLR